MRRVNLAEAKAHLSELIDAALGGEEIIIARRGHALIRLHVLDEARAKPEPGRFKGRIQMAADFDAPLDDLRDYSE